MKGTLFVGVFYSLFVSFYVSAVGIMFRVTVVVAGKSSISSSVRIKPRGTNYLFQSPLLLQSQQQLRPPIRIRGGSSDGSITIQEPLADGQNTDTSGVETRGESEERVPRPPSFVTSSYLSSSEETSEPQLVSSYAGSPQPSPPVVDSDAVAASLGKNNDMMEESQWRGLVSRHKEFIQLVTQRASEQWKLYTTATMRGNDDKVMGGHRSWMSTFFTSMFSRYPDWLLSSLFYTTQEGGGCPTFLGMYVGALLGASCGFYLFLYFISLGYAAGIGLPLSIALIHFIKTLATLNSNNGERIPNPANFFLLGASQRRTVLHTSLVLLWSLRMFVFLVWREYWNWPALHQRIVQVNQRPKQRQPQKIQDKLSSINPDAINNNSTQLPEEQTQIIDTSEPEPQQRQPPPTLPIKILCWLVYSFFYLCMLSPSYFRMRQELVSAITISSSNTMKTDDMSLRLPELENPLFVAAENAALSWQTLGLLLESVADWQKSTFKAQKKPQLKSSNSNNNNCRYEWCHTGLWKWFTHPNYLGEGLFWFGTFVGGSVPLLQNYAHQLAQQQQQQGHHRLVLPNPDLLWNCGFMILGLWFILKVLQGAIESLDARQNVKYGELPEYAEFRRNHGLWGRKWWVPPPTTKSKQHQQQQRDDEEAALSVLLSSETSATSNNETSAGVIEAQEVKAEENRSNNSRSRN